MTFSIKKYIDIAVTLSGLCLNYAAPLALKSHCWLSSLANLMWDFFLVSMFILVWLCW